VNIIQLAETIYYYLRWLKFELRTFKLFTLKNKLYPCKKIEHHPIYYLTKKIDIKIFFKNQKFKKK